MFRNLVLSMIFLTLISCQKRIWDNPYDSGCPKVLFTPTSITADILGNDIVISWVQNNTKVSGYKVYINETDGPFSEVATLPSSTKTWTHTNPTRNLKYGYKVVTTAGSNFSNEAYTTAYFPSYITIIPPSIITATNAVCGIEISNDGGNTIKVRGVCWGTLPNPTILQNQFTTDGMGIGSFISHISGLSPETKYYVRAYATNSIATIYGNEISFTTLANTGIIFNPDISYGSVTDIDGNIYKTVQIGMQTWMAENLRTTKYSNGNIIGTTIPSSFSIDNQSNPKYQWSCYGDENNVSIYGRLYTGYAATDIRGICPTGWHLPSDAEWQTLINYLGGETIAGGKLREIGTTHWVNSDINATNSSGFSAVPGGFRNDYGPFDNLGIYSYWWSSSVYDSNLAYVWFMLSSPILYKCGYYMDAGYSIRCVLDETIKLPILTTNSASSITSNTAISGGNITSDGGATITSRGVCWSTTQNPTIANIKTTDGSGTGDFTSFISGLTANTTYYVRAYATNSAGTGYGSQMSFTTGLLPVVAFTGIPTTINAGQSVQFTDQSTNSPTSWSWNFGDGSTGNSRNPTHNYSKAGSYNVSLTVSNSAGSNTLTKTNYITVNDINGILFNPNLAYGNVTDIDGNIYKTIQIGDQVWMAENLKVTKLNDGTAVRFESSNNSWMTIENASYCWYNNDVENRNTYGALYNRYAVNTDKLCPVGWHVSTDSNWSTLTKISGGDNYAAIKLKETGNVHWSGSSSNATNSNGFTALPGGIRNSDGSFSSLKNNGVWWCTNPENYAFSSWFRLMIYNSDDIQKYGLTLSPNLGLSVRCVKD